MKVAFYIDNSSISSVDCSTILDANPGIGGTECMIITVATLLAQRNNDIEAKLFTTHDGIFPASLSYKVVADFAHAISYAEENKYEYFVFKHDVQHIFNHSLDSVNNEVRLVVWCTFSLVIGNWIIMLTILPSIKWFVSAEKWRIYTGTIKYTTSHLIFIIV